MLQLVIQNCENEMLSFYFTLLMSSSKLYIALMSSENCKSISTACGKNMTCGRRYYIRSGEAATNDSVDPDI